KSCQNMLSSLESPKLLQVLPNVQYLPKQTKQVMTPKAPLAAISHANFADSGAFWDFRAQYPRSSNSFVDINSANQRFKSLDIISLKLLKKRPGVNNVHVTYKPL